MVPSWSRATAPTGDTELRASTNEAPTAPRAFCTLDVGAVGGDDLVAF